MPLVSLFVVPAAALTLILWPLGAADTGLALLGKALDPILAIAHWTASLNDQVSPGSGPPKPFDGLEWLLATLAIGYGDGLLRTLTGRGHAFIAGRTCRIMGRVSMDLTTVDVTGLEVAAGDTAELFGPNLALEAQAARAGSVGYELVTGLTPRVLRRYIGA